MKLLEGIQLHELVLIILGFILGLALIFILLVQSMRGRMNLKLLWGFAAPLVMIGYPSLQGNEFKNDVSRIDDLVLAVNRNPTDTVAQRTLIREIQTLPAERCVTSSDALTTIANAQAALGMYDSARVTIQKAATINPTNVKTVKSKQLIAKQWQLYKESDEKIEVIEHQVEQYRQNPIKNRHLKDSIALNLRTLNQPIHVDQEYVLTVAEAADIIGEKDAAEKLTNDVLRVNPKQEHAKKLKESMRLRASQTKPSTSKPTTSSQQRTTDVKVIPQVQSPVSIQLDTTRWQPKIIPKAVDAFRNWKEKRD